MLIQTHHYLATIIHDRVKSKYGIELKQDMLQYGSIKPDLCRRYARMPHFFEEGFSFFLEELQEIKESEKYSDTREFSIKLGVLLHFTADYFCYAHNEKFYKNSLWAHLSYEYKLHKFFHRYKPRELSFPQAPTVPMLVYMLRRRYLKLPPSVQKDADFIYYACSKITEMLIETVYLPQPQVA